MQTIKLILPGSFYDSQIYSGRLYLWHDDGSIRTVDWDRLIDNIEVPQDMQLVLSCAFQRSEYLYSNDAQFILGDAEVMDVMRRKFEKLAESDLQVSEKQLEEATLRQYQYNLPFPHADVTIYRNSLFVGDRSGLVSLYINRNNRKLLSRAIERLWDAPVLSVAASYATLALSAGSEGLYQLNLDRQNNSDLEKNIGNISDPLLSDRRPSSSVHWMYYSVFSSSYQGKGYLFDYDLNVQQVIEGSYRFSRYQRIQRQTLSIGEILDRNTNVPYAGEEDEGEGGFSWGLHDKICQATMGKINVVQYDPYEQEERRLRSIDRINLSGNKASGEIVNADSALFGYIVELEDGLVVVDSEMQQKWIDGEPINWRVFPRSIYYTNQLHVIYDDHLQVHSFNQDYFVSQSSKTAGTRHAIRLGRRIVY